MRTVSIRNVQNSSDPAFRYRMMREVVEAVQEPGTLFMPLLNLVTSFIDGLAGGGAGSSKQAYIRYLEANFPDLCQAVGADTFYTKYRCAAVHDFDCSFGYGIERDAAMSGQYCARERIAETGQVVTVLNIDRLVNEFLAHVRMLEQSHSASAV